MSLDIAGLSCLGVTWIFLRLSSRFTHIFTLSSSPIKTYRFWISLGYMQNACKCACVCFCRYITYVPINQTLILNENWHLAWQQLVDFWYSQIQQIINPLVTSNKVIWIILIVFHVEMRKISNNISFTKFYSKPNLLTSLIISTTQGFRLGILNYLLAFLGILTYKQGTEESYGSKKKKQR